MNPVGNNHHALKHGAMDEGIGTWGGAPRKLLEVMKKIKSLDVILSARDKTVRLKGRGNRLTGAQSSTSEDENSPPNRPRIIENVVQKNAHFLNVTTCNYIF